MREGFAGRVSSLLQDCHQRRSVGLAASYLLFFLARGTVDSSAVFRKDLGTEIGEKMPSPAPALHNRYFPASGHNRSQEKEDSVKLPPS